MNTNSVRFSEVFQSKAKVKGLTHDFYKYPARFNPQFVRSVLDEFSVPGDWILDPFMGGGTTVVESISSGRRVVGSDINELAQFVTRVKTTPLSCQDISEVLTWVKDVRKLESVCWTGNEPIDETVRNMPLEVYPFFATAIRLADQLSYRRRRWFARCALIRVGQWALDARMNTPAVTEISLKLECIVESMLFGLEDLVKVAGNAGIKKNKLTALRELRAYSAADPRFVRNLRRRGIRSRLVLTSPPYPGVHMLYHRWQIKGRRETPAPYWIADLQDGYGESFYTMGGRSTYGLHQYFKRFTGVHWEHS